MKFLPVASGSSIAACKHCSSVLSSFMSMSEMQTPALPLQPMDTGASQSSFSQPSSKSQDFAPRKSDVATKLPARVVPAAVKPGPPETSADMRSKRIAVSEIAKVSQEF